jgi:phosphate acetyltransferase/phosphate butyryltransferase
LNAAIAPWPGIATAHTKVPASVDGANLSEIAERQQIVDGPLDFDVAVDAAARTKHITSRLACAADIPIVPNIKAGNMIYKNLAFMTDARTAGLVVGARVPVVLTSRADTADARRFPAAAAVPYADALARDPAGILPEPTE